MNVFSDLQDTLTLLGIRSEVSEPAHSDGLWYLNSNHEGRYVSLSWSQKRQYQIAYTMEPEAPVKGVPDETHSDRYLAFHRVVVILGGQA